MPYLWPNCAYRDMQSCESVPAPVAQIDQALAEAREAEKLDPDNPELLNYLGLAFGPLIGGVLTESPANNGLTLLMSKMLLQGPSRRTAEEIASEIESVGGTMNAFTQIRGGEMQLKAAQARLHIQELNTALMAISSCSKTSDGKGLPVWR